MRRPLKPFVTEYRGGSRRQGNPQGPSLKMDPADLEAERSSPAAWPPRPAPVAPQEDTYEAALRAADALFAGRPRPPESAKPAKPASADAEAPSEAAPQPAGRILRAIDEAPSPELLRLEAEFAPKRRGRKPGSKNKPKLPAPAVAAAVGSSEMIPTIPAAGSALLQVRRQPDAVSLAAGAKGDRYAWVRTKLKPGQQWKRRIPKVAW